MSDTKKYQVARAFRLPGPAFEEGTIVDLDPAVAADFVRAGNLNEYVAPEDAAAAAQAKADADAKAEADAKAKADADAAAAAEAAGGAPAKEGETKV